MAPSILGLEIRRMGDLIESTNNIDFRNALVVARFEAERFVARFKAAGDEILGQMGTMKAELATMLLQVEQAANDAKDAAEDAGKWVAS